MILRTNLPCLTYINKARKEVMEEHFDEAWNFSESLAAVRRETKIVLLIKPAIS